MCLFPWRFQTLETSVWNELGSTTVGTVGGGGGAEEEELEEDELELELDEARVEALLSGLALCLAIMSATSCTREARQ